MATEVIMPKQGQSVETCIITKWIRQKGESVSTGDILFSYETDKAAFDLESPADGVLLDIFYDEGSEVPVLAAVAVIGLPGEKVSSPDPQKPTGSGSARETVSPESITMAAVSYLKTETKSPAVESGSSVRISPRARRIAAHKGIDFSNIKGSGPNGRIIASDIESVLSTKVLFAEAGVTSGADYNDKPLSNVRKIIARGMLASLQNSAQLTHHMSADVRRLLEARQKIKKNVTENKTRQDITLNDMISWCVIRALEKYPEANSHFLGESIRTFTKVHLGLAVDTPRGLMVPTIKNASEMDLEDLSKELKSAADSCKKGSISPELLQSASASFTISNLGNWGVEMFTPVINLPQCCILGVCAIVNRPASLGNNIFGFVPYIGLSLTYDHRAIDGGPATLFLREIKNQIENFSL